MLTATFKNSCSTFIEAKVALKDNS